MPADLRQVTIVVTVRERFSLSRRSLDAIYAHTPAPFKLVYVVGGAPPRTLRWLRREAARRGFTLVQRRHFLTPNESRNLGVALVDTDYVAFVENDVIPAPGWLEALLACAQRFQAPVVAPLICEGEPLHQVVHHAGGEISTSLEDFFASPWGERVVQDDIPLQGQPIGVVQRQPFEVQTGEFHCLLVHRRFLQERIGPFDEMMMSTREHLDFAMAVHEAGGRIMLTPDSIVTFLNPWAGKAIELQDIPYHLVRWSARWQHTSMARFKSKWGLDPELTSAEFAAGRYAENIARPYIAKVPVFGRSWKVRSLVVRASTPVLRRLGVLATRRAERRRAAAGLGRAAP